jgi:soluble lytic murein transglycosylase
MKPRLLLTGTFLTVLMGCATTSHQDLRIQQKVIPPTKSFLDRWNKASLAELEALVTGKNEQNLAWWKKYRLGTLYAQGGVPDKDKSCDLFSSLAQEPEFPLKDLALLRSRQVCPADKKIALPENVNPWYKTLYLDIRLAEKEDAATLYEKSRQESNLRKKEQWLLQALDKAKTAPPEGVSVADIQKALYRISPRFIPHPPSSEWLAVANDQRAHREFDKALATYKKVLRKGTLDERFHALKGLRQTYKIMERKNDYIAATADLVNWTRKQFTAHKKDSRAVARFHDAQVLLVRTLWTEDQTTQAVKTLNETQRLLKGRYPMDEVYFLQGRIEEEKGHLEKAQDYYDASYNEKTSLTGLPDKLLWLRAWNNFKLKKYAQAVQDFQQMRDKVKDPADKARASFWLARSLKITTRSSAAEDELKTLASQDPLGYYGLLAYRDLNTAMPAISVDPQAAMSLNLLPLGEIAAETRLTAEWLISVNETSFVERILNGIVADLKKQNVTRDETWLRVTSAYARAGLYLPLFSALGDLNPKVKDQLLNSHPDLLFPLPYQDLIERASQTSGTPASFMYSIIRQESAFNPEARSPVDARGLMQLLPSIAKTLAKENNLTYATADDLYRPEINIPLGAFELKNLMRRYNDQFIFATAAYNANGGAIRGWINSRYRPDPIEFIEEIPYEETRTYIKLVMRNYVFYSRLLNKNHSTLFPEKLLVFTSRPASLANSSRSETPSDAAAADKDQ